MSQPAQTTLLFTETMACYLCDNGKLPIVTLGELTPELLADFENGCYAYFTNKDKKTKQVAKIAWSLQDVRVQVQYRTNCETINNDGFQNFLQSVHSQWLAIGWEHDTKCIILSSSQGDRPVADWICLLESTNTVLVGTTSHLTTEQIHSHIKTHLHVDTLVTSHLAKVHLIKLYADFCKAIKLVDDTHLRNVPLLQEAIACMISPNMTNTTHHEHVVRNYTATTVSPSTSTTPCLPFLTDTECVLFIEYLECFKCRCFFALHMSRDCDIVPRRNS
jgi:hypothetical protein